MMKPATEVIMYGTLKIEAIEFDTLDDGQQDDNDEEEEADVKQDAPGLVLVAVWRLDDVSNATASSNALIQMVHEALEKQRKLEAESEATRLEYIFLQ